MLFKKRITYNEIKEGVTLQDLCTVLDAPVPKVLSAFKKKLIPNVTVGRAHLIPGSMLFLLGDADYVKEGIKEAMERKVFAVAVDKNTLKETGMATQGLPIIEVKDAAEKFGKFFELYKESHKGRTICYANVESNASLKQLLDKAVRKEVELDREDASAVLNEIAYQMLLISKKKKRYFLHDVDVSDEHYMKDIVGLLKADVVVLHDSSENMNANKMLLENASDDGIVVVNFDDPALASMKYGAKSLRTYGIDTKAPLDYRGKNVRKDGDMLHIDIEHHERETHVAVPVADDVDAYSILAAFIVGKLMRVKEVELADRMKKDLTEDSEGNIKYYGSNGLVVNFASADADRILKVLREAQNAVLEKVGRKIAIISGLTGSDEERAENTRKLVEEMKQIQLDEILVLAKDDVAAEDIDTYGDGKMLYQALIQAGMGSTKLALSFDELASYLENQVAEGDLILCTAAASFNPMAALDNRFGTNYSPSNRWIAEQAPVLVEGAYNYRVVPGIKQVAIVDVDFEMKREKELTLPSEITGLPVTMVRRRLFSKASFAKIDLGTNLRVISGGCFHSCSRLKTVDIPDSVVTVKRNAFRQCVGLKEVHFGKGIMTIEANAFRGCTALEKVYLPETVKCIEADAFPSHTEIIYYQ